MARAVPISASNAEVKDAVMANAEEDKGTLVGPPGFTQQQLDALLYKAGLYVAPPLPPQDVSGVPAEMLPVVEEAIKNGHTWSILAGGAIRVDH